MVRRRSVLLGLFAAVFLIAGTARAQVISEVFFNAPNAGGENAWEWVEIFNPDRADLEIAGMVVFTGTQGGTTYFGTVPAAAPALPQGMYAVFAKNIGLNLECGTAGIQAEVEGGFALTNGNNAFVALYPAGTLEGDIGTTTPLDAVPYGGFGLSEDSVSISLTDTALDNGVAGSWATVAFDGTCAPYGTAGTTPMYGNPGRPHTFCDTGTTPVCLCGDVTFIGACDGDTVQFCYNMTDPVEINCATEFGADATCGLLDCTDPDCQGYYCVADTGTSCEELWCDATVDPNDPNTPEGCIGGVCAASAACDPGSFTRTCDAATITYCNAYSAIEWDFDCSVGGAEPYTCGEDPNGDNTCLGLEDGICDPQQGYYCASGLACIAGVCTAIREDAGPPEDAAYEDAGGEDHYFVGCGSLTYIGECDGDTVSYCAENGQDVITIDCAAQFGSASTCGLLDCDDSSDCLGYYCVAEIGESCEELWCDVGASAGCLDGVCDTASDACDPSTFTRTCTNSVIEYCHPDAEMEWDFDCSMGGTEPYSCGTRSDGVLTCLGQLGGLCDPAQGYECGAGLICIEGVCAVRTGVDASMPDTSLPDTSLPDTSTVVEDAAGAEDAGDEDGAVVVVDAAMPDTSTAGTDATVVADGAVVTTDAALPDTSLPDTSTVTTDSGGGVDVVVVADGGVGTDAGSTVRRDAGSTEPPPEEGGCDCGCSAADPRAAALSVLGLALLSLVRRRRR